MISELIGNPQPSSRNEKSPVGRAGLRTGGALVKGPRLLHVEEERGGTATGGKLALPLLGDLLCLFAILAAHRKRQRAQAFLGDFLAALEAVAVIALLEPRERVDDLVQGLRLHLNECQLDIFLDI